MTTEIKKFKIDDLLVKVYAGEKEMGAAAADFVAGKITAAIAEKGSANLILATGTSQFSFLEALKEKEIEWSKITVFHLDEYTNLSDKHPASFRKFLNERILNLVKPGQVYLINEIGRASCRERV